ncbi:phage tail tape measure protein [Rhodoplanes elegans]|uniref:Phage tail tape measure protein n=1 Tax=Rhodoplanes elegans TaxID=29408 RepID=A0A327K089_9BRAD|nr:phage tail tape measure protein [Rhodoplanes elegans]MBK5960939.1 phage tail tape measure protein [Rhodoplanes elegans]RAI31233.1 phage tail tape measure protein [Rhodoplanes elegans]
MTILDVALRLKLISDLKRGAADAAKDLAGIKTAASSLNGTRGPDKLKRDIVEVSTASRQAGVHLATVRREAAGLGNVRGPDKLKRDLLETAAAARQANRELAGVRTAGTRSGIGPAAGAGALLAGRSVRQLAGGVTAYSTGRRASQGFVDMADFDRRMSRIGLTADAAASELAGARATVKDTANRTGLLIDDVTGGLEAIVAQGRSLKESLALLPSVATTAQASGAAVDDMAKSADSLGTHLKIGAKDMQGAFDILVAGGKAGQFELKDMARYLPSILPAVKALGVEGNAGLTQITALLQIMRKGAGTSEEAATDLTNVLAKMTSNETVKKFEKQGIDLEKVMANARKEGKNLLEVFADTTWKAIGGDLSKINKLFEDMQVQRGMRSWLSQRNELKRMQAEIARTAPGSVMKDAAALTNDARSAVNRLSDAWNGFWMSAGRALDAGGATKALEKFGGMLDTLTDRLANNPITNPGGFGESNRKLTEAWEREKSAIRAGQADQEVKRLEERLARVEAAAARGHPSSRRILPELRKELAEARARRGGAALAADALGEKAGVTITAEDMARIKREDYGRRVAKGTAAWRSGLTMPRSGPPKATPLPSTPEVPVLGFDDSTPGGRIFPKGVVPATPLKTLDDVRRKASDAGQALDQLGHKSVAPTVETGGLDQAIQKLGTIQSLLQRIGSMSVSPKVSPQVGQTAAVNSRQLGRLGDSTGVLFDRA